MGYEFGVSRRIYGVVSAIVIDNKHPEGDYRVKLKYPWIRDASAGDDADHVSPWARVTSLMAGPGRGFYNLPEVDDEVLVSFVHGDMRQPIVIGSLWNGTDSMPAGDNMSEGTNPFSEGDVGIGASCVDNNASGGENNARYFQSRSGHKMVFDDTAGAEQFVLMTNKGHTIQMKDDDETINIFDSSGGFRMQFDAANQKITVYSAKDIEIEAAENIHMIAGKDFILEVADNVKAEAGSKWEQESGGEMVLKAGPKIKQNAGKIELNC